MERLRSRRAEEHGFTLIELLVVVAIIGILVAIVLPNLMGLREKGWDTAAKSDLDSIQVAEETYFTDNNAYTADLTALDTFRGSADVSADVCTYTVDAVADRGYVAGASHDSSPNVYYFDSETGAVVDDPTGLGCTPTP